MIPSLPFKPRCTSWPLELQDYSRQLYGFPVCLFFCNSLRSLVLHQGLVFYEDTIRKRKINLESLIASDSSTSDYQTFYYDQTLDHFNYQPESYTTFRQRYVMNFKRWRGARTAAPILVYLGAESSIDGDVGSIGVLPENARLFGALELYIEHRFYGQSVPLESREEVMKNATIRGYFSSAQALADYVEIILHVKKNLSAESSPVIVAGGSYGGMLASWFRLKYPHVALGAIASSAPILYFDDIVPSNSYYVVVTKDFKEASLSCYDTIKSSWSEIDKIASKANGLSELTKKFKTCKPLKNASDLKDSLDSLYSVAAQYDVPSNYVNMVCKGIDGGSKGTDILGRIFSGVVAYYGEKDCYDFGDFFSAETLDGWNWQTCSDIVMPVDYGLNGTMFPASQFDYKEYKETCQHKYGVQPRPHWITTYYGGHHIKLILKRFGSNIIFTNGLRDPYSSAGVLENISNSIIAVTTKEGSHCLDILPALKDDPKWLTSQRIQQVKIMKRWFHEYYKDLHKLA
ncbi:lysosomal Pro-X carboxypeptidase-like [Fagus crenata]